MEKRDFKEGIIKLGMIKYFCCFEPSLVAVRGRRKMRRFFWRVKAEIKRQMKDYYLHHHHHHHHHHHQLKRSSCCCCRFSFHYDSFSYALNFDNENSSFFC
ncbi:hypothetical protein SAY87_019278 [Trapa incisa]|uniref:Uncharacterized protein n=1 Tax=Trapa incisa TaxID=236973 RepID=A0AAN7K269_9MYRT|nr:hypothetical protein SAY87_019278 [Trapa incisa]